MHYILAVAIFSTLTHILHSLQISATLEVANSVINQETSYTIKILRYIDPLTSSFIFPVTPVPVGSYIQVVFPNEYLPISSTASPICVDKSSGSTLVCAVTEANRTITIYNYYETAATVSNQQLNIEIGSIKNPNRATQTSNFEYYIKKPDNTPQDQSPSANNPAYRLTLTFQSASFSACSISANNNYVSTLSKLSFSITPTNTIPSSGKLIIDIPLQWSGDIENSITIQSSPSCLGISGISGSITCSYTIFSSPVNIARITVQSLSTSGISNPFQIDVSTILTPPFLNSQQTISISSQWSDDVPIDRCTSIIKNTVPIIFKSITFSSLNNQTVQSTFNSRLQLILNRPMYYQDEIKILVPSIFINNGQINVTSSNFAIFTTSVDSNIVTLSNFPSSPSTLATNSIISIFFNAIKNPNSVAPISITVSFERQNQVYQRSSVSYTATAGTNLQISIQNDNQAVNAINNTIIRLFDAALYIPQGSSLTMEYHSSILVPNMAETAVVRASLGGTVINGVTYQIQSNIMTINNLFTSQLNANSAIEIEIGLFYNPPTVKPTLYTFKILNSNYLITSNTFELTAALQTLKSNTISSSSMQVMASSVAYSITFQSNYGFRAISILLPSQISVISGYETTCSPNTYTSCTLVGNNLTFIGTMSAGVHTIQWGNNVNPNSFKPTSTFSIFTYSLGWGVERSTGYITLTMNAEASLVSGQISPNTYKNNQLTSVGIDFSIPSNSPSGPIEIAVPQVVDVSGSSCTVSSGESCSIIPPKIIVTFVNSSPVFGDPAKRLILTLVNTVNAFSFKVVPDFSLSLKTQDGYRSLTSTIPAWTNNLASTFTTSVSSTTAYKLQSALFTFSISGLTAKQTHINIKINEQFGGLTAAPTDATLISAHQVRYNIIGEGSSQLAFNLVTPQYTQDYTFTLKTYDADGFLIGSSTSNIWRHACYGTQCRACYANNSCINCYSQSISNFYIYSTATKQCSRQCNQGFYLSGSNCIPCDGNCKECITQATQCTACNSGKFLDTVFKACVDICPDQYYPNTLNQQCIACTSPCLLCSSSTSCLSCRQNFYLLGTQCLSNCPSQVMVNYNPDRTCRSCVPTCLTCLTHDYFCTSCNNSQLLYLENNQCVTQCDPNRFVKNGVCSPCQLPCRVCHNSTTTCASCFADQSLSLWFNYGCISPSQCAIGHYVNSVNLSCDACPTQCQQCTSLINCGACADGFFLYANQCNPTCPNTTFVNTGARTCDICTGCVTCSTQNVCTTCQVDQFLYGGQCYSVCPDSTYPTQDTNPSTVQVKICTNCQPQCPTCLNNNFCTSCVSGQKLYVGICYETCPVGSFQSSATTCTVCPQTCSTCTSLANCLTCKPSYSLENSQCVLNCNQGISSNQVCYPCGLHCADCVGVQCQECELNYYLLNGICLDNCSLSTLSLDGMTCVQCTVKFANCTTCNETNCLSCSDGELTNGMCVPCSEGYYSRNSFCVLCPSACTMCDNATYCTSCADNFYIQADFCTDVCPDNKVPNGTKCDFCITDCAICDNTTFMCSICNAGIYRHEGNCVAECPSPLVVNLNSTVCITQEDFAEEYSQESRPIYFPFSIAALIVFIVGIILKCHTKTMHLTAFLVSLLSWLELGSWILFLIIEYLFYVNLQTASIYGLACCAAGIGMLIISNFVFLRIYYKYFVGDMDFDKWQKSHVCVNMLFVVLSTIFSFKIHRLVYSRLLDREQLSLVLSSVKKLIPISILSVISIIVSSLPVCAGASLALYFSLNVDQQFLAAMDTLVVTGIMLILLIIDLKHPPNYLIDELETQNIKNKVYEEDDQKFSYSYQHGDLFGSENNDGSMSKQNLLVAKNASKEALDFKETAKRKFRNNYQNENAGNRTLRDGQSLENINNEDDQDSIQVQELQDVEEEVENKGPKWVQKIIDQHGYLIKYDENNDPVRYDEAGHRVEIDEQGNHHKYDEQGNQVKEDQNGNLVYYNKDGWIIDKKTKKLYDSRGYEVKKAENGQIEYYDENGYQVVNVQDGDSEKEIKIDEDGYQVIIKDGQHLKYDRENGYRVQKKDGKIIHLNEDGIHMRQDKDGKWECYDPEDNFILKKNPETGQYEKFDEYGFSIEKDQFGNVYRYEPETGYRIILDQDGNIKRYDKDGYLIKKGLDGQFQRFDKDGYLVITDPQTGQQKFFNQDGYLVQRDFYGNPTFYDDEGNTVKIDKQTGKHRKFNKEGLQIVQQNGEKYLKDKRGRKVVQFPEGYYEKYDQVGNKIWLDEDGYQLETDEHGNMLKFDKIGDLVSDDESEEEFKQAQDDGLQNAIVAQKKKERKKFKTVKQFDYQEQYKKMLHQDNPQILFQEEESEDEEELKQFHDYEPPVERELEKQYNTMYEIEMDEDLKKSYSMNSMNLQNLEDIEHTPWVNLRQKKGEEKEGQEKQIDENKMTIDPENNLEKFEAKSVADVSISQRSFENEGVIPISQKDSGADDDQLDSIEEIETGRRKKKLVNKRSHASFADQDRVETKSENNFMKTDNVPVTIQNNEHKSSKKKIYDSDQEIQSLEEEDWQNQDNPNIFYKEKLSNANTNANDKPLDFDDQEDILSDYIPQQSIDQNAKYPNKGSEENLMRKNKNPMQSIQEVEDQLFDKLKSEQAHNRHKVKRSEFALSGTPNPLVQYAKTIEQQKMLDKEKQQNQAKHRYRQFSSRR